MQDGRFLSLLHFGNAKCPASPGDFTTGMQGMSNKLDDTFYKFIPPETSIR